MTHASVKAVQVSIGEEEQRAVQRVLASGRLVQGAEVAAFEEEFGTLVEDRPCVAVNSGTSALHLGLLAAGIGAGDEVIVPSFTFAATANAVAMAGATPVFADIDADTYCLDPASVESLIGPRTVAVMPVHLYGQPADLDSLGTLAARHGLAVFEDACQAHAATWRDRPVGTFGTFAAFSFYATKNMTTGEGGMVVCENAATARRIRLLRNQGMEERYRNEIPGLNNRMTDLAAAIGRVQLTKLDGWTKSRQAVAERYDEALSAIPGLRVPHVAPQAQHVYHQYTLRLTDRDAVQAAILEGGVESTVFYPVPTHRLPTFAGGPDLPATDRAAQEVLSVPMRANLTDEEVDHVIHTLVRTVGSAHG